MINWLSLNWDKINWNSISAIAACVAAIATCLGVLATSILTYIIIRQTGKLNKMQIGIMNKQIEIDFLQHKKELIQVINLLKTFAYQIVNDTKRDIHMNEITILGTIEHFYKLETEQKVKEIEDKLRVMETALDAPISVDVGSIIWHYHRVHNYVHIMQQVGSDERTESFVEVFFSKTYALIDIIDEILNKLSEDKFYVTKEDKK